MSDYMSEESDGGYFDEEMTSERDGREEETEDSDEDDGGYGGMDMSITGLQKPKKKVSEVDYECLSSKDIEKGMEKEAIALSSMFGIDMPSSYVLLRYMQWNREKLIDKFMEEPDQVNEKAGVPSVSPNFTIPTPADKSAPPPPESTSEPTTSAPGSSPRRTTRSSSKNVVPTPAPVDDTVDSDDFSCPICCCPPEPSTGVMSLGCGHTFCSECWVTYLTKKIREEGEHSIRCMEGGCNYLVPDTIILGTYPGSSIEIDSETKDKFRELLIRYFVQCNNALRFCPAPGCDFTVQCSAASSKASLETMVPTVRCSNGHDYCFGCEEEGDHRPVICSIARLWLKKCQDDSETANWIKSNTKECPRCHSTIEKNGGCNHMTCKKCKNEFCWVCMGPWSEHGSAWYSCNRYDEKDGIDARDAQSRSRASLERYLHYYNRWANHEQSARLSLDLYAKTEKKMQEMQETSDLTWIQVQFAKKAVDEVIKCRMTLKWTYAMGYYLEKSNQKEIFEDNQRDLEKAVEALSELLERPIEPETVSSLRQQITDKTVYVLKRNEVMLEDTAQGYIDGRWSWQTEIAPFAN